MNKIKLRNFTISAMVLAAGVASVLAQSKACVDKKQIPSIFDPDCTGKTPTFGDIFANVLSFIPGAIGAVLFGVIIWGGVQVFTAGANDDGKKKGYKTIQNAMTGIVLLFISIGIITLIETIIGQRILFGIFVK